MSREEDSKRLKIVRSEGLTAFSCSSCRAEYKLDGGMRYCARCQEYLFIPCIDETNEFSKRAPEANSTLDTKQDMDSNTDHDACHVLDAVQRDSRSDCSVWSCGVDLPAIPTVGCGMQKNYRPSTGNHILEVYSCRHNNTKPDQGVQINYITAQVMREIKEREKLQQKHIDELRKMKKNCLRNIQTFRTEINKVLDRLEYAAIAELENKFLEMDNILQENFNKIQDALDILSKASEDIKLGLSKNVQNEQFCEDVFKTFETLLAEEPEAKRELFFIRNSKLLETLESFQSLGFCEYQEKQTLYQIQSTETINIRHGNDKEDCSIHSCCFTHTGDILMSDFKNKNVKVVDGTVYKVKDVLSLNHYPLSVCEVSESEAAVALTETRYFGGDNRIQFISTRDKLAPTRSITLGHCCTGISVIGSQIFVSNERKRVYVYNLEGELQKTMYLDQSGNEIFSKSYAITESDSGRMIHVTDLNRGLITLDKEGNLMWKYSGPELKMAWGVCTDGKGNIFVSGSNSSNVVQIGQGGNYLGDVVSETLNINDPQAICFDKKKSRLILTRYNCNYMYIFSLS